MRSEGDKKNIGFVADDPSVAKNLPEVLAYGDDGKLCGINLNNHVGVLHAALLELAKRVEMLEGA